MYSSLKSLSKSGLMSYYLSADCVSLLHLPNKTTAINVGKLAQFSLDLQDSQAHCYVIEPKTAKVAACRYITYAKYSWKFFQVPSPQTLLDW